MDNAFLAYGSECLDPEKFFISKDVRTCVSSCENARLGEITYRGRTVLKCFSESECRYRILELGEVDKKQTRCFEKGCPPDTIYTPSAAVDEVSFLSVDECQKTMYLNENSDRCLT